MLTPFGKALRQLRMERGLKLLDVAEALGVSSAYVSAIETGRKPIPDGFVSQIGRALKLSEEERNKLRRAADRTRKEVRVEKLQENQRELVAAFARKFDDLPDELLERLRAAVFKSLSSEHPFVRKRRGMVVQPMSMAAIRGFAEKVRGVFTKDTDILFPIMDVLELRLTKVIDGFYLDPIDEVDMGDLEGLVIAGENRLCLRNDVYEQACRGNGRARFTACHELAHFLMHRNVSMARVREDNVPIYCDSEWQADTFAGALMMSARHFPQFRTVEEAARACGMSTTAAKHQMMLYRKTA